MRARDVMTTPVITVMPMTSVKEAAAFLSSHGFTALPVMDGVRLVGIVTEGDLVRDRFPADARHPRPEPDTVRPGDTVGAVMTTTVVTTQPGTDVVELVRDMLGRDVRSVPVVDGGRVVGIVTRRDLVRALAREDHLLAADVRHRLAIYGGSSRWTVQVHDGEVAITDEFDNSTDRHVAAVLAESVPGVTRASVSGPKPASANGFRPRTSVGPTGG